jgi:hypothetical protein
MHTTLRTLLLGCILIPVSVFSQTLYTYDNDETGAVGTVVSGIAATGLSFVNGPVFSNACPEGYNSKTWSTSTGAFTTTYSAIEFTLTPDPGVTISVTGMEFDLRRNPQGPTRQRFAYSIDGGINWISNGSDYSVPSNNCNDGVNFFWDMTDFTATGPVIFRVYGWNASNTNGQHQVRNGVVYGSICANTAAIYPLGSAVTCKSDPFTFTTDACVGCTYQWYKNDNVIAGATTDSYSTTKPAYYNVQVTQSNGCTAYSGYTLLTVGENPNANIYHPNGLNLCAPDPGNNILIKVGYTATNTYQWYKDGEIYTGDGSDSWRIYPTATGVYRCSITSVYGCNRVTPPVMVVDICRTGDAAALEQIEVVPNPASDMVTVGYNFNENLTSAHIQLFNQLGALVYSSTTEVNGNSGNEQIDISQLPSGLYFVQISGGNSLITNQLVINR